MKIKRLMIALLLISTIATSSLFTLDAQAQGPGTKLQTWLLLSCAPDPVGVGQVIYVNPFMSKPPITAASQQGDRFSGITVEVTAPDGTKTTLGPLESDTTGGAYTSFTPKMTGNYTFKAFYPGQILTGDSKSFPGPVIGYGGNLQYIGTEMLPSESDEVTITVREEQVTSIYHSPPLPTEYWTRPIYATNYAWTSLGGSWFGLRASGFSTTGVFDAQGSFDPYTTAPNTGHILWTKSTKFGGQVGAPFPADQESQYESTSILWRQFEPIILNGILYYVHYPTIELKPSSWIAVDLRTGEEVWERSCGITGDEILRCGQILKHHTIQEYGSAAYLWSVPREGPMILRLYDANTGMHLANLTGATNTNFLMDFDFDAPMRGLSAYYGSLLGYTTTGNNVSMWNSTKALAALPASIHRTGISRDLRPTGDGNYSAGIQWTVPRSFQMTGGGSTGSLGIGATTPDVLLLRNAPEAYSGYSAGYQVTVGLDARTGAKLWGPLNQTIPGAQGAALSMLTYRDGVYVLHCKDTNTAWGYSYETGEYLWGPISLPGNAWSRISVAGSSAYGNVYIWDYGGNVNALDKDTGTLKWHRESRSSGYDTPLGLYSLWTYQQSIVDGKLFLAEGDLYNPPLYPCKILVVNATTGELVWDMLFCGPRMNSAHADGMMVWWNSFDNQIYCFGKGQTKTTIEASPKTSVHGSSVLIEGFVTDESAGTKHSELVARFPHGVPAIADESMSPWMEYVYMQQAKPTNTTGVKVTLNVLDSNNNYRTIGTATSNSDGFFKYKWTPDIEGEYTLYASFEGSESYWPSQAVTAFAVDTAITQATEQPIKSEPVTDLYFIPAVIAIIVTILIVGAIIMLMLRRRP